MQEGCYFLTRNMQLDYLPSSRAHRTVSLLLIVAISKHTLKQDTFILKHQRANGLKILCLHQASLQSRILCMSTQERLPKNHTFPLLHLSQAEFY